MRKWRHTDGCSVATAAQFHELLETIERRTGELGEGTWDVRWMGGILHAHTSRQGFADFDIPYPEKHAARTVAWLIDAVLARKQLRRERNDPTFGATRDR